jgi:acetyl-CoA carboxylase, biotin carboxylase subunit
VEKTIADLPVGPRGEYDGAPMFKKILIANRSEIAVRVIRACRELGIKSVAVYSQADAGALHTRLADEAVCIGPGPAAKSYLHIPALISVAEITGADAIHPGYGFLSENAAFAEIVQRCGLTFIGPSPAAMRAWGDKVSARTNATRFGLPLLPGTGVLENAAHAIQEAKRIGFPVILKASGGGGGRGMRVARNEEETARGFESATAEAASSFKNPDIYLEKFVEEPRHIEFQVLADNHGQVWTLGERECSMQRRHQKVIEEAPSPVMTQEIRARMGEVIRKAIRETNYTTLGTMEFLMDEDKNLYFMEMNTRVQVEHPVTEEVTGVDLVIAQIRAAAGEKLHRVPHQRGRPGVIRALAGKDHRIPPGRGRRCAGRLGGLRRFHRPVGVRLVDREGDHPRQHPRRSPPPDAPRPRRVHRRRDPHQHRPAQAAPVGRRRHRREDVDPHDRTLARQGLNGVLARPADPRSHRSARGLHAPRPAPPFLGVSWLFLAPGARLGLGTC